MPCTARPRWRLRPREPVGHLGVLRDRNGRKSGGIDRWRCGVDARPRPTVCSRTATWWRHSPHNTPSLVAWRIWVGCDRQTAAKPTTRSRNSTARCGPASPTPRWAMSSRRTRTPKRHNSGGPPTQARRGRWSPSHDGSHRRHEHAFKEHAPTARSHRRVAVPARECVRRTAPLPEAVAGTIGDADSRHSADRSDSCDGLAPSPASVALAGAVDDVRWRATRRRHVERHRGRCDHASDRRGTVRHARTGRKDGPRLAMGHRPTRHGHRHGRPGLELAA